MQTHGGVNAESAILAAERTFFIEILVDWNRNGLFNHALSDLSSYADDVLVDRNLSGSAPQEVMLIEGASAAEMTFTVGGETTSGLNFVGVFSPYNGLSPLYNVDPVGCEIKYRIGVETVAGVVWYSQFIGNVRLITPVRGTNAVEIRCLDRVEKLRVPVRFPVWGMSQYATQRGYEKAQLMDSAWVIDHCLRFGDTSPSEFRPLYKDEIINKTPATPNRDKGVRFFLTGNGSYVPTVGMVDDNTTLGFPHSEIGRPMYYANGRPHPNSPNPEKPPYSLSSLGPDNSGWSTVGNGVSYLLGYWGLWRDEVDAATYGAHYMGFTLNTFSPDGEWWKGAGRLTRVMQCYVGRHLKLVLVLYQGAFRAEIRNWETDAGVVTPWLTVPEADHITFDVRFSMGGDPLWVDTQVDVIMNGVVTWSTLADYESLDDGNPDFYQGFTAVIHQAGVSDLYWSTRAHNPETTVSEEDFQTHARKTAKYVAVLDRGMNKLTHLPATTAEDAWDIITKVAAAELGSVFWDEEGVFRFWNRDTILSMQATDVRVLSLDEVQELSITNSLDSVRNIVTSESVKGYAQKEILYTSSAIDEFYVPATSRRYFTLYLNDVQALDPPRFTRYETQTGSFPTWSSDDGSDSGFVAQWQKPGVGWTEDSSRVGDAWAEVFAYFDPDGNTILEVWNGAAEPLRLATGIAGESSSAALRVIGSRVKRDEKAVLTAMDKDSVAKYGRRNLPVTGEWVQWQPAVAFSLLQFLLPRSTQPIPTTEAIVIAGDPRLQLGDTFAIKDPDGLGETIRVQIYGISRHYSRDSGLTDTLSVEMLAPPRIGRWDSEQYGRWDTTFRWS